MAVRRTGSAETAPVDRPRVRSRVLLGAAALAAAVSAIACGGSSSSSPSPTTANGPPAQALAKGTISAVTSTSITVTTNKGKTETFQLAPNVTIKQRGRALTVSQLVPGETVSLFPSASGSVGSPEVGRITVKMPKSTPAPSASAAISAPPSSSP